MGSDKGEFWFSIFRFSWFGHQLAFTGAAAWVCLNGHFASVDMGVFSFEFKTLL
jgi:hypothetical protein